jgi:molybdenum cofactor cytidylyltransferase
MIAALILSAGASQRMGQAKALLRIGGASLFERVVDTARAAGAQLIVAVTAPPHGDSIVAQFADQPILWAQNPNPERGMLSSVQAGLPLIPAAALGTLVWPVDVPFIAVETVRRLLDGDLAQPAVLSCDGRGGHPLWLPRRLFDEAMALPPEVGLRALRQAHPPRRVEVADAEILRDLDTAEDLAAARARFES